MSSVDGSRVARVKLRSGIGRVKTTNRRSRFRERKCRTDLKVAFCVNRRGVPTPIGELSY
jgi:hypothetical protein